MPTVTRHTLRELERLSREYRIEFNTELDESEWPEAHKTTLKHIKELGTKQFSTYALDPVLAANAPWKAEIKSLAELLKEKSSRCRGQNENTWRMACEPIILARLSSEVVCGEAVGLNAIFGHREDATVRHDPEIVKKLPKTTERNIDYRVVEMWRGSILTSTGALQLLLLVDYVFDWARDVYREDIIKELRVLASGENEAASGIYTDTDIYSIRQSEVSRQIGQKGRDESSANGLFTLSISSALDGNSKHIHFSGSSVFQALKITNGSAQMRI
ncbi:hypothetical protein G7Z17_g11978 [Cylindrodendrum hubeiense]|uniref:Uncharacterized protein n=1 Tax=Cylindrodendrum hubeiense TaxID=595255 RepID=A0A9P5GZS4_9HYPO|nr:hypothetical protein G7Z17_g11978 [Cylindrodendrum hubeiense]